MIVYLNNNRWNKENGNTPDDDAVKSTWRVDSGLSAHNKTHQKTERVSIL
ncbi:conserved hypothetical protein [delta proteobacterium NaphS2]|nr:conserved hypothetical protein [delta proteobacterium NaphS2]